MKKKKKEINWRCDIAADSRYTLIQRALESPLDRHVRFYNS